MKSQPKLFAAVVLIAGLPGAALAQGAPTFSRPPIAVPPVTAPPATRPPFVAPPVPTPPVSGPQLASVPETPPGVAVRDEARANRQAPLNAAQQAVDHADENAGLATEEPAPTP